MLLIDFVHCVLLICSVMLTYQVTVVYWCNFYLIKGHFCGDCLHVPGFHSLHWRLFPKVLFVNLSQCVSNGNDLARLDYFYWASIYTHAANYIRISQLLCMPTLGKSTACFSCLFVLLLLLSVWCCSKGGASCNVCAPHVHITFLWWSRVKGNCNWADVLKLDFITS